MKLVKINNEDKVMFFCPGCQSGHYAQLSGDGPKWTWNGSMESPTFSPSILVQGVEELTDEEFAAYMDGKGLPEKKKTVCHSFVTDGKIQFLGDCTHALAGQTVDLPEV